MPVMPAVLGEGAQGGLPSQEPCTASFTHKEHLSKSEIDQDSDNFIFYIILCPPSQNDILAVQGN